MAGDSKLSAREAALIAQARDELARQAAVRPDASAPAVQASVPITPPAAAAAPSADSPQPDDPAPPPAAAAAPDAAERAAALLAAARAETELLRRRWRRIYVWMPVAVLAAIGLWLLFLLW